MELLEKIRAAGVVGLGGAGFPTHCKLDCKVEYLILNGAECEPLLRTDRYFMKHKAAEIVAAAGWMAEAVGAKKSFIALKETYIEEIESLNTEICRQKSLVKLFKMKNFYPAGDEQVMVCDVTGRTAPPSGIPRDVGAVVSNVATAYAVYEAAEDRPLTHKYLTVAGEVSHPVIVRVPLGASYAACLEAAGGASIENYYVLSGGPLMGRLYSREEASSLVVTKTTSGMILVPADAELVRQRALSLRTVLRQAKTACIQCACCTDMCPRYLLGHPLKPHKIMRKLAYAEDITSILQDEDVRQAQICSECGICETYACPMGLSPRQVNIYIKAELQKAGLRYQKPGLHFEEREERGWRRAPSKRIAMRLGVGKHYDDTIDELAEVEVSRVEIPLKQHIGAPSIPVVKKGDRVFCGQIIASCPETGLCANLHASINGVVASIGERIVIEGGGDR